MLHDAQVSCFFLVWVSDVVSKFLMSLVEYGVFCEASSVVILAGGVFLHPLPSPAFVLLGGWVQKCGFEWVESGCV